jgi:hypothetical protein
MKISEAQLQALKDQYGKVWVIGFNDTASDDETSVDYDPEYPSCDFAFKKMDFDLFAASAALAMEKPIQAIKMQMEATMVAGDKTYLQDPVILGSISSEFAKITRARTAKLKKN